MAPLNGLLVVDLTRYLPGAYAGRELLRLGAFITDYYMSPIGETLRALVPARLPASGAARVRLTKRGVFLPAAEGSERDVVEALIAGGDTTVANLAARFPGQGFAETLERLESAGYVSMSSGEGSGARYRAAVELPDGALDRQLEAAGYRRSPVNGMRKPARSLLARLRLSAAS